MSERSIDELLKEIDRALYVRRLGDHNSPEWRKASAELPRLFEEVRERSAAIIGLCAWRAVAELATHDPAFAAAIGDRVKVQLRKHGFELVLLAASAMD